MKKLLAIFIALVTLLCVTGCTTAKKDNKEYNSYDVTIKITSNYGGEWIMPPDIEEMDIEIPYDGLERYFYVERYQLKDHPTLGGIWITPSYENVFYVTMLKKVTDSGYEDVDYITEPGDYCCLITTNTADSLFNFRAAHLHVKIK